MLLLVSGTRHVLPAIRIRSVLPYCETLSAVSPPSILSDDACRAFPSTDNAQKSFNISLPIISVRSCPFSFMFVHLILYFLLCALFASVQAPHVEFKRDHTVLRHGDMSLPPAVSLMSLILMPPRSAAICSYHIFRIDVCVVPSRPICRPTCSSVVEYPHMFILFAQYLPEGQ